MQARRPKQRPASVAAAGTPPTASSFVQQQQLALQQQQQQQQQQPAPQQQQQQPAAEPAPPLGPQAAAAAQRQQLLAAHQQMLGYAGPAAQRPPASAQGQQLQPLPAAPSLAAHLLPPGHTQRQGSRQGSSAVGDMSRLGRGLRPAPSAQAAAQMLAQQQLAAQAAAQAAAAGGPQTVSASVPAVSFLGGAVPGAASLVPSVQSVAARLGMRPAISASTGNLLAAQGAAPGTLAAGPLSPASETSMRFVTGPPRRDHWKPDSEAPECSLCGQRFGLLNRRHHCRRCGDIFCGACCGRAVRLDQDANFHPAGLISRVCEPCFKEFQSHLHPLKPPLPIVNDTQDHAGEDETNAIPITLKENTKDVAQTPMMSVPTDWTWSSF